MADTINVQQLLEQIADLEQQTTSHYKQDQKAAQQRLQQAQNQARESLVQERNFEIQQARASNAKIAGFRLTRRNAFGNLQEARLDSKLAQTHLSKKAAEIIANRNLIRSRPIIEAREQVQMEKSMQNQISIKVDQRLNNILSFRRQTEQQRLSTLKN